MERGIQHGEEDINWGEENKLTNGKQIGEEDVTLEQRTIYKTVNDSRYRIQSNF